MCKCAICPGGKVGPSPAAPVTFDGGRTTCAAAAVRHAAASRPRSGEAMGPCEGARGEGMRREKGSGVKLKLTLMTLHSS